MGVGSDDKAMKNSQQTELIHDSTSSTELQLNFAYYEYYKNIIL